MQAEYINHLWLRLRKYAKGDIRTTLNKIDVPEYNSTGEIINFCTVTDASERMFQHLLHRNSEHFSQAAITPFVNCIFGTHLRPFQQNDFSAAILHGTTDITSFKVNEALQACIQEMRCLP